MKGVDLESCGRSLFDDKPLKSLSRIKLWQPPIAIFTVTSFIVINVPTTDLMAVETKILLFCGWQDLNIKTIGCKQWISLFPTPSFTYSQKLVFLRVLKYARAKSFRAFKPMTFQVILALLQCRQGSSYLRWLTCDSGFMPAAAMYVSPMVLIFSMHWKRGSERSWTWRYLLALNMYRYNTIS